uniref:Arf-GAP with dual PH domain-containing protein 1 n=1 Tax=Lotharella globosa TaxID=91324 RepID=A0A6V3JSM4_9EUKA|mmetsp:Transcript_1377/g.2619  ORF Transcript_1377/g.2619 Transcript_1377/m.2619 type:complete len:382 (+) Transcript_1377:220-1365(+)|eukprot:CAMPEP_0167797652 /NCGR_PEP_ID=MMETSP0111_2-20121227/15794_1 /TAXON_ID=91324 /ORGANISM="Lotharella globosa, Strain CCCM811" /LENGTH=381 /DNA_ID=CAMNT_0007691823 /DNA_START=134 /DNA_END=1279 /DNA_ORIENTATION=+
MSATKTLAKIKELQQIDGNSSCTDCGSDDVSWAVMNHGFFICVNCAGIHRGLGVHHSQVRSTELDIKCWNDTILGEFRKKGNSKARRTFEKDVPSYYLTPYDCTSDLVRKHWIETKYVAQSFTEDKPSMVKVRMPERAMVGWLNKCNDSGKWQRRYVVLYRDKLSYFADSATSLPKGSIPLPNTKVTIPDRQRGEGAKAPPFDRFKFTVKTQDRTFTFAPDSVDKLFDWVHAVRRSSIFYGESKFKQLPQVNETKKEYQALGSNVQFQGVLGKQGGSFMTWKTRWCVLSGHVLYYFKSSNTPKPGDSCAGSIPIVMCDVREADEKMNKKSNCFCLHTTDRTFFFQASSPDLRSKWVTKLSQSVESLREQVGKDYEFIRQKA